jgi:hypothetical protein
MSLIAHYRLDDNAASTVVLDSSGNGYHGVAARNTNLTYAVGKIGGALNFNGTTDQITLGTLSIANNAPFTACVWHKLTAFLDPYPVLLKLKDSVSIYAWWMALSNQAGYLGHTFGGADASGYAKRKSGIAAAALVGVWAHYAVVYNGLGASDAANFTLYYNASPQSTTSVTTYGAELNTSMISSVASGYGRVNGLLDDVRIYNTALSAPEVLAVYRLGKLALKAGSQYLTLSIT